MDPQRDGDLHSEAGLRAAHGKEAHCFSDTASENFQHESPYFSFRYTHEQLFFYTLLLGLAEKINFNKQAGLKKKVGDTNRKVPP